jgi:DNA-binding IclR family transcriptional regulator
MEQYSINMRLVKGLLDRCVDVTELLAAAPAAMRLSDIAQTLDLQKSATHRLLAELSARGWVRQVGLDGPYELTLRFALLGTRVLRGIGVIEVAQPLLDRLAVRTRELVRLTVVTGKGLAWLSSAQGALPGLMYQPAMDGVPVLHATANGKVFLASLPDEAALSMASASGLGRLRPTPRTLDREASLLADLAVIRSRGWAVAEQEAEIGVTALAVGVRGRDGVLRGTISVAGPALRMNEKQEAILAGLGETADELGAIWPEGALA